MSVNYEERKKNTNLDRFMIKPTKLPETEESRPEPIPSPTKPIEITESIINQALAQICVEDAEKAMLQAETPLNSVWVSDMKVPIPHTEDFEQFRIRLQKDNINDIEIQRLWDIVLTKRQKQNKIGGNMVETIKETANQIVTEQGIKLSKGMKGVYSWEIKINSLDIDELERLNKDMLKRFSA